MAGHSTQYHLPAGTKDQIEPAETIGLPLVSTSGGVLRGWCSVEPDSHLLSSARNLVVIIHGMYRKRSKRRK